MSFNLSPYEIAAVAVNMFGALQKPEEFTKLLELLLAREPKTVLEIGIGNCGSTWAFSKIPSVEHIICIDLPDGNWGGQSQAFTQERLQYIASHSKAKVIYIAGNSQNSECLEKVKQALGEGLVDFLFVDGDHSYNGVKTDFLTYSPLVSKPGLIGFHDIRVHPPETLCEVSKFWDEIKASGIPSEDYAEFIDQDESLWAGIGIVQW